MIELRKRSAPADISCVRRSVRLAKASIAAFAVFALTLGPINEASSGDLPGPIETPYFAADVEAGKLPPVAERIPQVPAIVVMDSDKQPGEHGGQLETLMAKAKDIRLMTVYGYARLVAYDENLELVPDIVESFEVKEGRVFTFRLRKGHKWSDGHPFTIEDFRYFWEDMVNNEDLAPFGPPRVLTVDGELANFEILDDVTFRYSWSKPNPDFLTSLAGAAPFFIYRPSHYLKQFHQTYQDPEKLAKLIEDYRQRNWAGLHNHVDRQYRFDNPDLPTLQPWLNTVEMPSDRFIFVRNPYYHRVDQNGRQLPYIDEFIVKIADGKIIPAKAGAGETDLQARYLRFDHYTFLKGAEERTNIEVRLWKTIKGSQFALFPNLNAYDDVWRELLRDARFRRALSLAIDRHEINQAIYYGLAREGANTVLEESPLYRDEYRTKWAEFDLAQANALLDEIGMTERDDRGIRLLPDGRPAEIIIDTAGESTEETDVLELIHDSWLQAGIKLYSRPSQREVFRNRIFSGDAIMSVWSGLTNAVSRPSMSPHELAPTEMHQYQWPMFGKYYETSGQAGKEPDMPLVKELWGLHAAWRHTTDPEEQERIWHRMLEINSDQVYTIGVVNGVLQPVVVNKELRNVPEEGFYNWDPGAVFGIYKPDTFWFTEKRRTHTAASN